MSCSCPTYKVDISPDDVINLLSEGKRCRPCIGCKQWKNCPQRITTALSCFVFGYLELVYRNSINYIYEYIGDDIQTFLQSPKRIRHVCSIVRDYLLRKMKLTRTEANIAIEMWKSFAFGVENFNSP